MLITSPYILLFLVISHACITEVAGNGNFLIHGHFDIFMTKFNETRCSVLNTDIGIMFVEAMFFAIDQINEAEILPGMRFSIKILDTCRDTKLNPYFLILDNALALVGPYTSELSEFSTKFLSIFKITEVSYGASSEKLSNRKEFPQFYRTVPENRYPVHAYMALAMRFQWRFVGILYTHNEDGSSITMALMNEMLANKMCVPVQESINSDGQITHYQNAITKVLNQEKIKVVFLFLSIKGCRSFFRAAITFKNQLRNLQFVLGTSCSSMVIIPKSIQKYFHGMLTVQVSNPQPKAFQKYFEQLTPQNNTRNKYFCLYWEKVYNCTLKNSNTSNFCKQITNTKYNKYAPVRPVIEAVYAIAYGLSDAVNATCKQKANKDECLKAPSTKEYIKLNLYKHMPLVTYTSGERTFKFTDDGGVISDYDVLQYQETNTEFSFTKVGFWDLKKWQKKDAALTLDSVLNLTSSVCSLPCEQQEIIEPNDIFGCCWQCKPCEKTAIITNNTCVTCPKGYKANAEQSTCLQLSLSTMSSKHTISIVVKVISIFGLLVSLIVLIIYLRHYSTTIIKATSRELALCSLLGLTFMLITPLIFILEPTVLICDAQKIMFGLSLTTTYAPLVLKTNRIYRIFVSSHKFKLKRLMLVTMPSQFLLIAAMLGVELVMGVFWILTDKPAVKISYPINKDYVVKACSIRGTSGALNLLFPVSLMVASTFWAFKTRNLPEIFSEIKSIGATMYITLFLSTGAFGLIVMLSSQVEFAESYILCFTFQAIAVVTLIGQYAMKIKSLYFDPDLEPNQHTETEFSTVMTNKFSSPVSSPKCQTNSNIGSPKVMNRGLSPSTSQRNKSERNTLP